MYVDEVTAIMILSPVCMYSTTQTVLEVNVLQKQSLV